jgi:hypothetical protein
VKLDQILKWVATATLIVGTVFNAGFPDLYPVGPLILAAGGYIWLVVSIMWKDWALIATNIVMSTTGLVLTLINLFG